MTGTSAGDARVLILKNTLSEGPGSIADFLRRQAISSCVVELHAGEELPELSSFSHLVVLGGPMAVYEMDRYPYLVKEATFLDRALKAGKHMLGVCLGAQMLAHVLGGRVYPGGRKEIGWYAVALTEEGMKDAVLSTLSADGKQYARVFQWHGDTFDLPEGAVRLASSELYSNQAFRYDKAVYALQFHIEVTPMIVREWLVHERQIDVNAIHSASEKIYPAYGERALNFYRKFFLA